jgi:hypothetical protein
MSSGKHVHKDKIAAILDELTLSRFYRVSNIGKRHGVTRNAIHQLERRERIKNQKRSGARLVQPLQGKRPKLRDEHSDRLLQSRRGGDLSECPEPTWTDAILGFSERREQDIQKRQQIVSKRISYEGRWYASVASAARELGLTRYSMAQKLKA